jgi:hypothetical protein
MAICNLDFIKNITPGSTTFTIKVIQLFLKDTPETIISLKSAINNSDWEKAYTEAHKIKPSVLMLGFPSENTDALLTILKLTQTKKNTDQVNEFLNIFTRNMTDIYRDLEISLKDMLSK